MTRMAVATHWYGSLLEANCVAKDAHRLDLDLYDISILEP
jgi:hypothetical protein